MLYWLIYIAVVIASAAFAVLYKDVIAVLLFAVIVLLPVLLLIAAIITRALTKVQVEIKDSVVKNGETAVLKITVNNRSPFSSGAVIVAIKCKNKFLQLESTCKAVVNARALAIGTYDFEISCEHIGILEISVERAQIYDKLRLFRFTQKLNYSGILSFIPETETLIANVRQNLYSVGESDTFSKTKSGDDPSEVFDIRDYKGGDKLNRIHWKLTVKQDKYMVKEYSFPINESILLFADLSVEDLLTFSADRFDAMFGALISVAYELVRQGRNVKIGWYDRKFSRYLCDEVTSPDEIYASIGNIFSSQIDVEFPQLMYSQLLDKNRPSHICMFSTQTAEYAVNELRPIASDSLFCSAVLAREKKEQFEKSAEDNILLYQARDGKIADDLSGIVI